MCVKLLKTVGKVSVRYCESLLIYLPILSSHTSVVFLVLGWPVDTLLLSVLMITENPLGKALSECQRWPTLPM